MQETERIDLAHVPNFKLGRLTVRPALRQVVRDDVRHGRAKAGGRHAQLELASRCAPNAPRVVAAFD